MALGIILILLLLYGWPIFLLDRMARRNGCSGRRRVVIAVLVLFYLPWLFPILIAMRLAAKKPLDWRVTITKAPPHYGHGGGGSDPGGIADPTRDALEATQRSYEQSQEE